MKAVLLITFNYPPRPSSGSVRPDGLRKYLPQFGWRPIILTAEYPGRDRLDEYILETSFTNPFGGLKKKFGFGEHIPILTSLKIEPPEIKKTSLRHRLLSSLITNFRTIASFPEAEISWLKSALPASLDLLSKDRDIMAIISSSPPVVAHRIAHQIKKDFPIPWIAEFRDLWTQNPYYRYGTFRRMIERRMEIHTLRNADCFVTVSNPWALQLQELHHRDYISVIPNGFDPQTWVETPRELTKEFTILHTGLLYDGKRHPGLLFEAIDWLLERQKIDPKKIKINFMGQPEIWIETMIVRYGLSGIAEQLGLYSREETLTRQRESQVLLLLLGSNPDEAGTFPAKVFEYLSARRPILAIGGEQGRKDIGNLLEETQTGFYCSSISEILHTLEGWIAEFDQSGRVSSIGNREAIWRHSQVEMARKYAGLLTQVTT